MTATQAQQIEIVARRLCGNRDPDMLATTQRPIQVLDLDGRHIGAFPEGSLRPLWTFYISAARLALGISNDPEIRERYQRQQSVSQTP